MNAVCVYVAAARLVMQTEPHSDSLTNTISTSTTDNNAALQQQNQRRLSDLNQLLPQLRQLLSCVVCCRLLTDPYSPRDARCQHPVCRLCVRGRKTLRPFCSVCKDYADYKAYDENKQIRCLLLCYKSLCAHMKSSWLFNQLNKQKPASNQSLPANSSPSIPPPSLSTQELVLEGASYEDVLSSFATDLHAPIIPMPRLQLAQAQPTPTKAVLISTTLPLVTPLAPNALYSNKSAAQQTPPKTLIPPAQSSAPPLLVKKELISPPLTRTALPSVNVQTHLTKLSQQPKIQQQPHQQQKHSSLVNISSSASNLTPTSTTTMNAQTLTLKHLKSFVDLTAMGTVSACNTRTPTTAPCNVAKTVGNATMMPIGTPTFTYMGTHTPSVVVPIVSSSATTSAPLSIASSKLQTLNRQFMRARTALGTNAAFIPAVSSTGEVIKPLTFKLVASSMATSTTPAVVTVANSIMTTASSTANTATVTSPQQVRNPPPIKTVSNGSAMYSVLYTGIGNKITIKRKTDGESDDFVQRVSIHSNSRNPSER